MRTTATWVGLLLAALIGVATAATAGKPGTITGEVIDSACYIKQGARGPDHAKCAEGCARMGVPLALLTDDGQVVWLSSSKDMESVNDLLTGHVAKKVTLEGEWFERGGAKLFSVNKVTAAKP